MEYIAQRAGHGHAAAVRAFARFANALQKLHAHGSARWPERPPASMPECLNASCQPVGPLQARQTSYERPPASALVPAQPLGPSQARQPSYPPTLSVIAHLHAAVDETLLQLIPAVSKAQHSTTCSAQHSILSRPALRARTA